MEITKQNIKVLYAEDDPVIAKILLKVMGRLFESIEYFENGEDAWNYYKTNHTDIDLLVTDIVMPKMNGIELIRAVHSFSEHSIVSAPANPKIPVIAITANTPEYQTDLFELDIIVLQKPLQISELVDCINNIFDVQEIKR